MKTRFYFQEYDPSRHQQLYRWHWQTAMGAGEYDVPKCAPNTPPEQCTHTINATIRHVISHRSPQMCANAVFVCFYLIRRYLERTPQSFTHTIRHTHAYLMV